MVFSHFFLDLYGHYGRLGVSKFIISIRKVGGGFVVMGSPVYAVGGGVYWERREMVGNPTFVESS